MNDSQTPTQPDNASDFDQHAALFAHLIMQQASSAMLLMGKTPNPETGETMKDLDGAKLFIDLLETLEVKTKGNLSKSEAQMLKQTLMSLRMAYVETVDQATQAPEKAAAPEAPKPAEAPSADASSSSDEGRVKFSKKY